MMELSHPHHFPFLTVESRYRLRLKGHLAETLGRHRARQVDFAFSVVALAMTLEAVILPPAQQIGQTH